MKRRIIVALCLAAVTAAAVTAATLGATKKATADSITVWLQVDAQSGWPTVVAAANKAFEAQHPGVKVNVQYQQWNTHLQKFDATLAGGSVPGRDRDGQYGDDEVHGGRRVRRPDRRQVEVPELLDLAQGPRSSRRPTTASSMGVPYYAGSRVVIYNTDLFKKAGVTGTPTEPRPVHRRRQEAHDGEQRATRRFSAFYVAGQGLVLGAGLRLRLRRADRHVGRAASGSARSTSRRRSPGLNAFKNTFLALSRASKTTDEANPFPTDAVLAGPRGVVRRPRLAVRLRARPEGRQPEAEAGHGRVPDAEPHRRARRCRRSSAAPTSAIPASSSNQDLAEDWIADFTANAADGGHRQGGEPPQHDLAAQPRQGHPGLGARRSRRRSTWFVPTAKNWTNVESANVLRTMLTNILTGKADRAAGGQVGE